MPNGVKKPKPAHTQPKLDFFYKNGLYIDRREIVLGTNSLSDDDSLTHIDLIDLQKNLILMEETQTGDKEKDQVNIRLCSMGGSIYTALGMYDLIKSQKYTVNIITYGSCMSSALLVLQSADKRLAYKNTSFLIHGIETVLEKDTLTPKDRKMENEECKRLEKLMLNIFLENTSLTKDQILTLLEDDKYFGTEEAIELGFIDEII